MLYKLLIVDDEPIEREALTFIIEQNCRHIEIVGAAANGREAIQKSEQHKPDIIFMDIKMPGINGLEAAQSIKQSHSACKIVFLSAFNYFDYAQKALEIGAVEYILKPVSNEQVIEVVNKLTNMLEMESISKQKDQEIISKLHTALNYLEGEFLHSLISGAMEKQQLEDYLTLLNIRFRSGVAVVMNIQYYKFPSDASTEARRHMVRLRCMEKIKHLFEDHFSKSILVASKETVYCLLIDSEGNLYGKEDILCIVGGASKTVRTELGLGMNIGVSEICDDIHDMAGAFIQAQLASIQADHNIPLIHYGDLSHTQKLSNGYPLDKEKQLCESMIRCDEELALQMLDQIFDWIVSSHSKMKLEEIKMKAYDLTVVMARFALQECGSHVFQTKDYYSLLHASETIETIRLRLREIMIGMIEALHEQKMDKNGSLIETVCEYIHDNYMKEIKLDEMAGMINYSTYYFSKMFKYYKKQNFIDYITSVRVDKAKGLLRNSSLTVKEIGSLVGYGDQNYFTRVFKKIEGVTPTDFRDKISSWAH